MRNRPRFDKWSADLKIRFDADHISANDVVNLLARAGAQVGICEGRPGAPNSYGIGFGTFLVKSKAKAVAVVRKPDKVAPKRKVNGNGVRPEARA